MKAHDYALNIGMKVADTYRNALNNYQGMTNEQRHLLGYIVADALHKERLRVRKLNRRKKYARR